VLPQTTAQTPYATHGRTVERGVAPGKAGVLFPEGRYGLDLDEVAVVELPDRDTARAGDGPENAGVGRVHESQSERSAT
jgi:hypothetical protein